MTKRVFVRDGQIVLADGGFEYPIDLNRCKSAEALLGWLSHISEKSWVTTEHIHDLITLASTENGIEIDYHA